jgi:hypothetical protein
LTQVDQLNSGFAPKLGIQTQYLDGEGYLVADALSGAMAAGKEFEVGLGIMLPVAVYVVDGLFLAEFSADLLLHDVAMLKHLSTLPVNVSGNRDPNVAMSLDVLLVGPAQEFFTRETAVIPALTLNATELLLPVDGGPSCSSPSEKITAVEARNGVFGVGSLASTGVRAFHLAVHRVFAVLLPVGIEEPELHREGFTAFLARKWDGSFVRGWATVSLLVKSQARLAAEFLFFFALARDLELAAALLANLVDRHLISPVVDALRTRKNNSGFGYVGQLI